MHPVVAFNGILWIKEDDGVWKSGCGHYPDAYTAATLCGPGVACKNILKITNVIDKKILLQNIVVYTARLLGNRVAFVSTVPLIWAVFADVDDSFLCLPDDLKNRF